MTKRATFTLGSCIRFQKSITQSTKYQIGNHYGTQSLQALAGKRGKFTDKANKYKSIPGKTMKLYSENEKIVIKADGEWFKCGYILDQIEPYQI